MINEEIVLDKKILKVLGSERRTAILKLLSEHQLTLTDISEKLGISIANAKEHLEKLEDAGLVKKLEEGRKWKYYVLTNIGADILKSSTIEKKFVIIFVISIIGLLGSIWFLNAWIEIEGGQIKGQTSWVPVFGITTTASMDVATINKDMNKAEPLSEYTAKNETKKETYAQNENVKIEYYIFLLFIMLFAFVSGYSISKIKQTRLI